MEYVVTDITGAQDGPFRLSLKGGCPKVPDRVPPPAKKKKDEEGRDAQGDSRLGRRSLSEGVPEHRYA